MVSGYEALPSSSDSETYGLRDSSELLLPKKIPHLASFTLTDDGTGYNYAYGPKGIRGFIHNYVSFGCAVFASIGGLTFGYDQGVIANVLVMKDFKAKWPIGPWEKGLMTAVLELGALFGALIAGILADRCSRRHSIFIASVVFCIGSVFQCAAHSLTDLVFGRAVGGLGVGALSMLSPLYMAEISPPELRGSLVALEQLAIVLGVVFGFWTGFFTRSINGSMSWRIPLGVQIIPGVLLCGGSLFLPSSPRLLVIRGQFDKAFNSLASLRMRSPAEAMVDPLLQLEMLEMRVEASVIREVNPRGGNSAMRSEALTWVRLFERRYIDRTIVGVLIMFFQQWSGINALLYYGPTLVRSIGISGDDDMLIVAGGIGIVQFIAVLPAIVYIDRIGRKPLLRVGSIMMTASHLIIAILVYKFSNDWDTNYSAAWLAVGCIYVFTFFYGISFGPVGWVLPAEVFPISLRSKGVALSTASNWTNNFIIGLLTPPLMDISPGMTFLTFSVACFFAYLFSTYLVPETANVSLEEIDAVFRSPAGQEEMAIRKQFERDLGLDALIKCLGGRDSGQRMRRGTQQSQDFPPANYNIYCAEDNTHH